MFFSSSFFSTSLTFLWEFIKRHDPVIRVCAPQVPRLRRALSPSRGPAEGLRPHQPVVHDRPERLRLLVPQGAEGGPRPGLHVHGKEGLLRPLPLHVLQPAGADLHPLLCGRRLHRLPVCDALHLLDVPHRCDQVRTAFQFSFVNFSFLFLHLFFFFILFYFSSSGSATPSVR